MNSTSFFLEVQRFRSMAEIAWSAQTAYPDQFDPARPSKGQCGVTSICLGLWLAAEYGLALENMAYTRGKLKHEDKAIGPNHSWLEMQLERTLWRADLTPDQYPETHPIEMIVEPVGMPYTGLGYETEKSTPLPEYNITNMHGRLAVMAEILGLGLSSLLGA